MITLMTPHAESMYDPAGPQQAFNAMRERIGQIAAKIAKTSDCRVLRITSSGPEEPPESCRGAERNPLVIRIRQLPIDPNDNQLGKAMRAAYPLKTAVGMFCNVRGLRKHLVIIDDVDFYFCPRKEPGTFTWKLDSDLDLITQINTIGTCVTGYEGHLVLAATLSPGPQRLYEFLDSYGWSWVRYCADDFEVQFGSIPDVLKPYCHPKREPGPPIEWSEPMTIGQLAKLFGVSRNTMPKRLRDGTIPSRKFKSLFQIPISLLPLKRDST